MSKSNLVKTGIEVAGNVARNNLERLGALLDKIEANTEKATQYNAVNIDDVDDPKGDDMFRKQTVEASQQLIGKRFSRYGKYAKKVVPNSVVNNAMNGVFNQVAKLAATWSELDLPNENRLAGVSSLTEFERNALATDIANQNRALATMGGITGLAGLPGLFADTVWLLLVSLRTVYQIAAIYDKPLTGKQGVKLAYRVLEAADLSKMQEKQALLAGIGISKTLLEESTSGGLLGNLDAAGVGDDTIKFYAEQVDSITEQFNLDLDSINLSWLVKLVPLSSVAVGAYYNNYLINQVIGVANATFAPEPKMAKKALMDESDVSDPDSSDNSNKSDDKATHIKAVTDKAEAVKDVVKQDVTNMAKDIKQTLQQDAQTVKDDVAQIKEDIKTMSDDVKQTATKDGKALADDVKERLNHSDSDNKADDEGNDNRDTDKNTDTTDGSQDATK